MPGNMVKTEDGTRGYLHRKSSAGSTQVWEPSYCEPGPGWPWEYKIEKDTSWSWMSMRVCACTLL